MPDQTKSIQSGGGSDYTTIQTFENDLDVSGGFWKGEIDDNSAYDEVVTVSGGTGTPNVNNYFWLTGGASNQHSGSAGTGHPRVVVDTASGHAFTVGSDFARFSLLEIKQESPGTSDEAFRINSGCDDLLIERCIIWTDSTTADTDGIYSGNSDCSVTVVNCTVYGWQRCGMHVQNFSGNTTQRWAIEHCSLYNNGSAGEVEAGGIRVRTAGSSTSIDLIINNTACLATNNKDDYEHTTSSGAAPGGETVKVTWTGSNNADSDNSIAGGDISAEAGDTIDTNTQASLVATTVWTDPANGDFTVVNSQGLDDNGASFTSDDTRADVSVDIAGTSRSGSTPDIGAFEESAAGETIVADSGSYAWTGQTANLLYNKALDANAGSYAWTGQTANLLKGSKVTAEAGSYAWSGQDASLLYNQLISAEAGSYAWTGQDATLSHLMGETLTAEAGSYAWTGQDVTFLYDQILTAEAGAYIWSGQSASLEYSGASIWTPTSAAATTWSEKLKQSSTWTPKSKASTTWTES